MKVTGSTVQQLDRKRPDGRPLPRSECRRWRLWATTSDGRRSRRFGGTWTQAQEALRVFVAELEAFVPNSDTFASYAASWASWRAGACALSPNTVASEATCVAALSRSPLGPMRMDEVSPDDCREALLWLRSHPLKGAEYSPSTLAKLHQVLGAIMRQAAEDGRIASNPMERVRRPKVRAAEREALSPGELQLLLNRVDALPLDGRSMAVYLMACLGLRVGEACALADANVDGRYARVDATVRAADRTVGPPKSDAGIRVLPVPPRLAAKVREWRACRSALGLADAPTLCCNSRGGLLTTAAMEGWWAGSKGCAGARDKLGCDGMTLHQLRHSNLSMMARHMGAFDLKAYAGWSSIAPARIYVHDDMDAVARAVEAAWAL